MVGRRGTMGDAQRKREFRAEGMGLNVRFNLNPYYELN